jgi:Kef-type K+ transport system membrane component KefB
VLYRLPQRDKIIKSTTAIGHFFVPIFFAAVGAAVDLKALADPRALLIGGVLIVCGIVGKVAAGYGAWWFKGKKLLVGIAMVPRGEVGLIFAQMGLTAGALNGGEYGALMLMVLVTTLVTPPALARLSRHYGKVASALPVPDDGGVDDLVAGRPHNKQ